LPGTPVLLHILAAALLPWTPRQAIKPLAAVLVINLVVLLASTDAVAAVVWTIISLFIAAPGVLVAWVKHTRRMETFKLRFLQSRYGQMRRELVDARRIHESLFPPPRRGGRVQFDYRYEPMRQ